MTETKKLDLLLSIYIMSIVAAELLGAKIFTFWGINASVGIFTLPLTFTINDIVSEVYGKERASSFVRSGFVVLVMLFFFIYLSILLPPAARFRNTNLAYITIFSTSLRIIIASLTAFWVSERFDIFIYNKIRNRFGLSKLWLRNNLSNIIGQLADTTIFMTLAFYSPGNQMFIISLIIPYWILKCAFSFIETPFTYLGVKWLKKSI
jgi:queuosine precursor transporter